MLSRFIYCLFLILNNSTASTPALCKSHKLGSEMNWCFIWNVSCWFAGPKLAWNSTRGNRGILLHCTKSYVNFWNTEISLLTTFWPRSFHVLTWRLPLEVEIQIPHSAWLHEFIKLDDFFFKYKARVHGFQKWGKVIKNDRYESRMNKRSARKKADRMQSFLGCFW